MSVNDKSELKKIDEKAIVNVWGHSSLGIEAKNAAMSMLATKHGLYSKIPISCKSDDCPYRESCVLLRCGIAPEGEICPVEAAQIEMRYEGYNKDFNLDTSSFTDKNIVSEIINLDIQIERCKALMAKEGVPVVDVIVGVDENTGSPLYRPEVSKFQDAYERVLEKRNKLYNLMEATRKDRKEQGPESKSIEQIISAALAMDANDEFIIEERPEGL